MAGPALPVAQVDSPVAESAAAAAKSLQLTSPGAAALPTAQEMLTVAESAEPVPAPAVSPAPEVPMPSPMLQQPLSTPQEDSQDAPLGMPLVIVPLASPAVQQALPAEQQEASGVPAVPQPAAASSAAQAAPTWAAVHGTAASLAAAAASPAVQKGTGSPSFQGFQASSTPMTQQAGQATPVMMFPGGWPSGTVQESVAAVPSGHQHNAALTPGAHPVKLYIAVATKIYGFAL